MGKDWTGNGNSVYKILTASNHTDAEREVNDFYATDPDSLEAFLKVSDKDFHLADNIWESACGEGHLSKTLISHGYNVYSSDIIDRGFKGTVVQDFLNATKRPFEHMSILTNPPYKYSLEFTKKALELLKDGEYLVMFLKIQFLEGKARYNLFQEHPVKYVYVHSSRQTAAKNGKFMIKNKKGEDVKTGSAVCYAWFVWEKGYKGDSIIRWIE